MTKDTDDLLTAELCLSEYRKYSDGRTSEERTEKQSLRNL
jgi:hypothetical protein